jgi:hypothetical protein
MIVYGTAKNPAAPVAKISAGTATNVYAVYRSPPSRNQVKMRHKKRQDDIDRRYENNPCKLE